MASEKVISERRDSMVIVIFKSLNEAETKIPKKLTKLIKKKIYMEWTEDPEEQADWWTPSRVMSDTMLTVRHVRVVFKSRLSLCYKCRKN